MNANIKKMRETSLRGLVALSVLTALAAASARAQTRDVHFISARAGVVNYVTGDVKTRRADEKSWQRLTSRDDLQTGDAVRTGADGRVEVLLNPGSYFRAGAYTEFDLVDASLDNLQLKLARGGAVVEATGYDRLGLDIVVATPGARVHIIRTGVYRLSILPSGETEVAVQKGRALVGEGDAAQLVKGGKVARVGTGGGVELAKLDKSSLDALDQWSRDRGKELAKLNETLARRQVNNTMLARAGFSQGYSYGGVWAFSASFGCYTFLPFYWGWSSPYGYGYNSWLYTPRYYPGTYNGGTTTIGQGGYRPGGNANPPGNSGGNSPGTNTYPGNFNPPPTPPSAPMPTRDVPSRSDVDRPMPERTREPGSRP
jgi:hypothetical protein